jgi:SAM-dependent methyltransferase
MKADLWRLGQWLVAPDARRRLIRAVKPEDGQILDVGCGPDSLLWAAELEPTGVDISAEFARAFRRRSERIVVASATDLPFADDIFDSVYSFGLLHHLSDADATVAVLEMLRVTRHGGRTLVLDAVLPLSSWRRPVAALLRHMDRGHWMRRQEAIEALLSATGGWRFQRIAYSYTGLEAVVCEHRGISIDTGIGGKA